MNLPRRLWNRVTHIGVDATVPGGEIRYIAVINVACVLGLFVDILALPTFLQNLPEAWPFVALMGVGFIAHAIPLVLNHLKHHVAARVALAVGLTIQIVPSVLIAGLGANYHWFLVLLILGGFFVTPARQQRLLAIPVVFYITLLLALLNYDGVLVPLPPETLTVMSRVNFGFFLLCVVVLCFFNYRVLVSYEQDIEREKRKSEDLLLNVLPAPIAARLKSGEGSIADRFEDTTILFADIVGFTKISGDLTPSELVRFLDEVFTLFDGLTEKYGLEKIKTIGDAYMVAGGLSGAPHDHHQAMAELALSMIDQVAGHFAHRLGGFNIRVGIHSGPTVAGVIGRRKFIYDLWGDSVNMASRMESHGEQGRIQVTRELYRRLRDRYDFQYRGTILVKGKGNIETWYLLGRRKVGLE